MSMDVEWIGINETVGGRDHYDWCRYAVTVEEFWISWRWSMPILPLRGQHSGRVPNAEGTWWRQANSLLGFAIDAVWVADGITRRWNTTSKVMANLEIIGSGKLALTIPFHKRMKILIRPMPISFTRSKCVFNQKYICPKDSDALRNLPQKYISQVTMAPAPRGE